MQISLDQDSYQAKIDGDAHFFLRRLITPSYRLTDLNFGKVPAGQQPAALHHFMVCTGGWPLETVEYDAIGYDDDSASALDARPDEVRHLIEKALPFRKILKIEREAIWQRVLLRMHLEH
jgi:hypothetical protein